jgi:hypothetical protein
VLLLSIIGNGGSERNVIFHAYPILFLLIFAVHPGLDKKHALFLKIPVKFYARVGPCVVKSGLRAVTPLLFIDITAQIGYHNIIILGNLNNLAGGKA